MRQMLFGSLLLLGAIGPASAICVDISVPKNSVEIDGGKWTELTEVQRAFVVGVYTMNPTTPAGLPYGDRAALAEPIDMLGGVVFFLDDGKACSWMPVPKELIGIIKQIGDGTIRHEGIEN